MSELSRTQNRDLLAEFNELTKLSVDKPTYDSLHKRELFPYDDDAFFAQRLTQKSRVVRQNVGLREILTETFLTDDSDELYATNEIISQLDTWPQKAPNLISKIIDHLNFCMEADNIKIDAVGVKSPTDKSNYLMHSHGLRLLKSTPPEQVHELLAALSYTRHRLQSLYESTRSEAFEFCNSKNESLFRNTANRLFSLRYLDLLLPDDVEQHSDEEVIKDSADVEKVFFEMSSSRTHGLALGYIKHSLGGSHVFHDMNEIVDKWKKAMPELNMSELVFRTPAKVNITHSTYAHPRYLKTKVTREQGRFDHVAIGSIDLKPLNYFYIDHKGELYSDIRCEMPLSYIAASIGKYEGYRLLQAEMIGHYYNLTHATPIDMSAVPTATKTSPERLPTEMPIEILRRLIIPRSSHKQHRVNLEESSATRSMKFHDVVWHRRKLPEGWNPSPEALQLAEEAGIVLEPGETFVRDHSRGSKELGRIAGHQFIARP